MTPRSSRLLIVLAMALLFSVFSQAQVLSNNEVQFSGTVTSVAPNGEGGGTLFVHIDNVDLRVIVNPAAHLRDLKSDPMKLEDVTTGMMVEVTGKFSSSGIVASTLQVLEKVDTDFDIRGHITDVQASQTGTLISLLGITIAVPGDTPIHQDGATVPVSVLKIGTGIQAAGTVAGGTWTATSITIDTGTRKKANSHLREPSFRIAHKPKI